MAKFLAFKRATSRVVTIDSIQSTITDLGTALPTAETASLFPGRSQNLVATYLGNYYALYLDVSGEVKLTKYDGTGWPDHVPFAAINPGIGAAVPIGCQVIRDRLVAVAATGNTAGVDSIIAVRSNSNSDGVFASASFVFPVQPTVTQGGHIVAWKNALWIATSVGLLWYDPATATFAPALDTGSDADVTGDKVTFGSFASYGNDLYFILPTVSALQTPKLYKLDPAWSLAAPPAAPAWTKVTVAIPSAGPLFVGPDTSPYALFTNRAGKLTAWFSGNTETKVVTFEATTSGLTSTDVTNATLDLAIRSIPNAGWTMMNDDRRRTNELQTIVARDIAASPQKVHFFSWDGASQATLDASFDTLDLMLPNDERGDFRIFTDTQPACFVTAFTQPFPGRVEVSYTLRDTGSRPMDVFGEYSIDKQTWLPMTHGDGDDGDTALASTPGGSAYTYYWDAWQDLTDDYDFIDIRMVARISGV